MQSPVILQEFSDDSSAAARRIVSEALGIPRGAVKSCRFLLPASRNRVWKCRITGWADPVYLKVQGGTLPSETVCHEARVLELLGKLEFPLVPRILVWGRLGGNSTGFSILSGLPGSTLKKHLVARGPLQVPPRRILEWLDVLNGLPAQALSSLLPRNLTDRFMPSFDPIRVGLKNFRMMDANVAPPAARLYLEKLEHLPWNAPSVPRLIHGSFTVFNILAESHRLTGVLDFESTRVGEPSEDHGSLAYYLSQEVSESAAMQWLQWITLRQGELDVRCKAIPFMLWFALSRSRSCQVRWNRIERLIRPWS